MLFFYIIIKTEFLCRILLVRNYNHNMDILGKFTVMDYLQAINVAQNIVFNLKWADVSWKLY